MTCCTAGSPCPRCSNWTDCCGPWPASSGGAPAAVARAHPADVRPAAARVRRLRGADRAAFAALRAVFIAPPPRGMAQTIVQDLDAVRATSLAQARREIRACLERRPSTDQRVLAVLRSRTVVDQLADILATAWPELLAAEGLACKRSANGTSCTGRPNWDGPAGSPPSPGCLMCAGAAVGSRSPEAVAGSVPAQRGRPLARPVGVRVARRWPSSPKNRGRGRSCTRRGARPRCGPSRPAGTGSAGRPARALAGKAARRARYPASTTQLARATGRLRARSGTTWL